MFACQEQEAAIETLQLVSLGQTEYNQGDPFSFEGSSIIVRYKNGTEEKVMLDSSMISSYDSTKIGDQYVIISYKGKSIAYKITVNKPKIATINVDLQPENVNYIEGQDFKVAGAKLLITYENDTTEEIPLENYMVTGYDKNLIGNQAVSVKYREEFSNGNYKDHLLTVQATVSKKEIVSIEVFKSPNKTVYFLGEEEPLFDGGILLIKYNNGYTEKVDFIKEKNIEEITDNDSSELIDNLTYTWDSSVASESTFVNLQYYDQQKDIYHITRYSVKIRKRDIKEYKFLNADGNSIGTNLELIQIQNSEFNFYGHKIAIVYNDEKTNETIDLSESPERYVITDYNNETLAKQNVYLQIKYNNLILDKTIPIEVDVKQEVFERLELEVPSNLYVDTPINYKYWNFRYIYNSGNISGVSEVSDGVEIYYFKNGERHKFSDLAVVQFDEPGIYQIEAELSSDPNVKYTGEMEINPMEIDLLELVGVPILEAYFGDEEVDPKDTKIKVKYKNGFYKKINGEEEIQVTSDMITFDAYTSGSSYATITYFDVEYNILGSVEIEIKIINKIPEISIEENPKLTYFINQEFDYSDMSIKFKYASDTTEEIIRSGIAITNEGFYFSIEGQEEDYGLFFVREGEVVVKLSHSGMVGSLEITVNVIKKPIEMGYLYYSGHDADGNFISEYRGNSFGNVIEGLDINLDNMYIEIKFEGSNDFELVKLTKEMLSYKKTDTTIGNRFLEITYPFDVEPSEQIIGYNYSVNVIEKEVVALEIPSDSVPRMTEYTRNPTAGATEEFVYFGLRIIKIYSNGTTQEIELNNSEFDFARVPIDLPAGSEVDIKISYLFDSSVFVFYTVSIVEQTIKEVKWDKDKNTNVNWFDGIMPTVYVTEGQDIDFMNLYAEVQEGLGVATSFDNLYITEIDAMGGSTSVAYSTARNYITQVLGYEKEQGPGEQYVELLYKNNKIPIHVKVKRSVLYSIEIDEENIEKIKAIQGGDLIIDDTYFIAVYRAEGASEEGGQGQSTEKRRFVKLELEHIQKSENNPDGYDKTDATLRDREVTIYYLGKTTQITVNVVEKEVESIIIGGLFKSAFVEGEEFSYVSKDDHNVYPTLQVNYTNGLTNGIYKNGILTFPTVNDLVNEGNLIIDSSSFDSSDFTGVPKTQTIRLIYTSEYGMATYSYNVVVYDRKNSSFKLQGENNFIYGDAVEPTFNVNGYDKVLNEDGSEDTSPIGISLSRGFLHDSITSGFYYVFYIPTEMFNPNSFIYQTLFDEDLSEYNLLNSQETQYKGLRVYTKFPSNVGTYKIVVISLGDKIHNGFRYYAENNSDIKDLKIEKRDIYIKVAENSKIYGKAMPEMLIELRSSPSSSIFEDPMMVFAEQDREKGFESDGFSGENLEEEKTEVKISDKSGNPIDDRLYDCFDIVYISETQGSKRILEFNEPAGDYRVKIQPILVNPNYNLIYTESNFNIKKRKVNVYPKINVDFPTWQHGQPRPAIDYEHSKLSVEEATVASEEENYVINPDDTGLFPGDVLSGNLSADLDLDYDILEQLEPKDPSDPDNVIGYVQISNGTLTSNANRNYDIILKHHTKDNPNEEVFVKYLKRTLYIKVKSQVRIYGSAWNDSNISLIFTKQSAGDVTEEDAFAPTSNNQRETISDVATLSYLYFLIDPITNEKIEINNITEDVGVGSVEVQLSINSEGEKFPFYHIELVNGEIKTAKRNVLIIPTGDIKVFGEDDPIFIFETQSLPHENESGLLEGDSLLGDGKLSRDPGESVGEYRISLGTLSENNPNYNLVLGKNPLTNDDAFLEIVKRQIFVGFDASALRKEYDGLKGTINKSDMTLYIKKLDGSYEEIIGFDYNDISISLQQQSKNIGFYDIDAFSLNPNYQASILKHNNEDVSYEIYQKTVEVDLKTGEYILENNTTLEYSGDGYVLEFIVEPSQLCFIYDENDQLINDGEDFKRDVVTVQLEAKIDGELILGNRISNIGTYLIAPVPTLSNNNYKLSEPLDTYYIHIISKTLLVKLKNADEETHVISREYNGNAIEITSADYEIIPEIPASLRPTLTLGIIGEEEIPKNVLVDENGDILSYEIGITQNSNNPNYIYKLYFQDYEYQIKPKNVVMQISNNNLQQSYNGAPPFIKEFNITGTVQGEILNNENIRFVFSREANDNRANSDAGRYQVSAVSLNPNYYVKLYQDYVFTILQTTGVARLNKTQLYNPLQKEIIEGNPNLPFLLPTDFIFTEAIPPKIRNFVGEDEKNEHINRLGLLTNGVARVRSTFYALNLRGSKEALINGISSVKTAINDIATETNIIYYYHFSDISDELFEELNIVRSRIDEISDLYNQGHDVMKNKFDELLLHVNQANLIMDRENNYISFTFNEAEYKEHFIEGENPNFVVDQIISFTFDSHGYNTVYTWNENSSVVIIRKHVLLKIDDKTVKYGTVVEEQDVNFSIEVYDLHGNYIEQSLFNPNDPTVLGFNLNCGTYDVSIEAMILNELYSQKYIIDLHPSTPNPKLIIEKNNITVVMLDVGAEGNLIYGTPISASMINEYRYLDLSNQEDKLLAIEYYNNIHGTESVTDEELISFFGEKKFLTENVGSDYINSIINTNGASYHLYLKSEYQEGNLDDKYGQSNIDSDDYVIVAEDFNATNYDVKIIPGILRVSRETANIELQAGNAISRKYSESFNLRFNFPNLPLGESSDVMLYKLNQEGVLSPSIGRISENSNIFIDQNATDSDVLDERTSAGLLGNKFLILTNMIGTDEIVAKNYKFNFDPDGYKVLITKKELYLTVTDLDGKQGMTVEYGTFDNPSGVKGSNNDAYKITYEGFASWDEELLNPSVNLQPGKQNAPKFNLYSVASFTAKPVSQTDMTWNALDSDETLLNYQAIVLDGTTLKTNKKVVKIGINPEKLKTAFSFYTNDGFYASFSDMTIYPYLSEILLKIKEPQDEETEPEFIFENYKIIGGTYGPMDFVFIDGSEAAYDEKLHSETSDILDRGGFNLDISPYVGESSFVGYENIDGDDWRVEILKEINKKEIFFNHKIYVEKTSTGWKVTVSNFSPTSNYVVPDQIVEFSDSEVEYVYQVADIMPTRKEIFYDSNYNDWQSGSKFPFYVFDTSYSEGLYNQYLSGGVDNFEIGEEYKFNLGNKQYPNLSLEPIAPNTINTVYPVILKFKSNEYLDDNALETATDYPDYFLFNGTMPAKYIRKTFTTERLSMEKMLPLIFKEKTSQTMQDMENKEYLGDSIPYRMRELTHVLEDDSSSLYDKYFEAYDFDNDVARSEIYDKLSFTFSAKKIADNEKSIALGFVLGHFIKDVNEPSIKYPGYTRKKKHSVLLFRMDNNDKVYDKYYLDNGQDFVLEHRVYYELEDGGDFIEIEQIYYSMPFVIHSIFDGYLHTFNFYHDKANMMIYVDVDNSQTNAISLNNLIYLSFKENSETEMYFNKGIEPTTVYPDPVGIGVLSANLDIKIVRMSLANQGFYDVGGSKLVLSSEFNSIVKNASLGYDKVINKDLIAQDVTLKYYLNGEECDESLTSFNLKFGANKLEIYAYKEEGSELVLIDRLLAYAYYYQSGNTNDNKYFDYSVTYTNDANGTIKVNPQANSFYFDGDMSIGNSQELLTYRWLKYYNIITSGQLENSNPDYNSDLYYYLDNDPDNKILLGSDFNAPRFNIVNPDTSDNGELNIGEDMGRTFKFEPSEQNVSSVSMTFKLFDSLNVSNDNPLIGRPTNPDDPDGLKNYDVEFKVKKERTKFEIMLFKNNATNSAIVISNTLYVDDENAPGIYHKNGNKYDKLSENIDFEAQKDYQITILKTETGLSLVLYEDNIKILGIPLLNDIASTLSNTFEAHFAFGRAIIKDVIFNYTHDVNQNRLIVNGEDLIEASKETQIDALGTTKEIEEFRKTPERDILETGYANFKYKIDSEGENAKSTIILEDIINNNNKLTFDLSSTSIKFSYQSVMRKEEVDEEGNLSIVEVIKSSVVQNIPITLSPDVEYTIKISLGEEITVDAASLPNGLVEEYASGEIYCTLVYFYIDNNEYTFYLPEKYGNQDNWIVNYNYSNEEGSYYNDVSCYTMKMEFNDIKATISEFGLYKYRNFDFIGYTLSEIPENEIYP